MNEKNDRYVGYLRGLKQDRGAMAALRSGLGKRPGTAPRMFPYVAPWMPEDGEGAKAYAVFLTASLFAMHPAEGGVGNLAASLNRAFPPKTTGREGVERMLVMAMDAYPDDVSRHLEGLVHRCLGESIPVDWTRFLLDAETLLTVPRQEWQREGRERTMRHWARAFWGGKTPKGEEDQNEG